MYNRNALCHLCNVIFAFTIKLIAHKRAFTIMQTDNIQVSTQKYVIVRDAASSCNVFCCFTRTRNNHIIDFTPHQLFGVNIRFAKNM